MHSHFWEYTRVMDGISRVCVIEICVYSSLKTMRIGAARHRGSVPDPEDFSYSKLLGMCRSWTEFDSAGNILLPVSRIFLAKGYPLGILVHEIHHAALYFERAFTGQACRRNVTLGSDESSSKRFCEERSAYLAEIIFNDIYGWMLDAYPNKPPKQISLPCIPNFQAKP